MADIIQANHDQLQGMATKFAQQSQTVAQTQQAVQRSYQPLRTGGWIGRGSEAFFKEMEGQVLPSVQRLSAALAQAQKVTQQISALLRQADEEASSPFKQDTGAVAGEGGGTASGAAGGAAGGAGGAWDTGGFSPGTGNLAPDLGALGFLPGGSGDVQGILDDLAHNIGSLLGDGGAAELGSNFFPGDIVNDFVGDDSDVFGDPFGELSSGVVGDYGGSGDPEYTIRPPAMSDGMPVSSSGDSDYASRPPEMSDGSSGISSANPDYASRPFEMADVGVPGGTGYGDPFGASDGLASGSGYDAAAFVGRPSEVASLDGSNDSLQSASGSGTGELSGLGAAESGLGGGSSGGGSGSGSQSASPSESTSKPASQPTGDGSGGGGSAPTLETQSPFGRDMARGFSAGSGSQGSDAAALAAAQQARLRYQSTSGSSGAGELRETVRVIKTGSAPGVPVEATGVSSLPFGLAAASPFLVLLGKIVKDKSEKHD